MTQRRQNFELGDYVDVAARIAEFREKHPDGSLQPANPSEPYRVERIGDDTYIVVVAAAYRTPDDQRPGIGMAYEPYPGRTPYTRGSELQNAETSAWGRAIVAALAADTRRGIASAEEVRNRRAERGELPQPPTRAQIVARARDAIATATEDALDGYRERVDALELEGLITADDAIDLRRRIVARLDELRPAGEQQVVESAAADWPEPAEVPA